MCVLSAGCRLRYTDRDTSVIVSNVVGVIIILILIIMCIACDELSLGRNNGTFRCTAV